MNSHGPAPVLSGAKINQWPAGRLSELCASGFWYCPNCGGINTREEDDHGQPACCGVCGSVKIHLVPASMPELIEPQDLYDR
jgi:hypothetical protein